MACIVGAKMTGRFVEPQYQHLAVNVNVQLGERPLQQFSVEQLEAILAQLEKAKGQVVEVKALPAGEQDST